MANWEGAVKFVVEYPKPLSQGFFKADFLGPGRMEKKGEDGKVGKSNEMR